jgi:CHASE2 domain-containing sensor protein
MSQQAPLLSRKPSLWTTLVAVLWSFLGVRKGSDFQKDIQQLNPFHIIAVGVAACFVFVIGLMLFVQWVVKTTPAL